MDDTNSCVIHFDFMRLNLQQSQRIHLQSISDTYKKCIRLLLHKQSHPVKVLTGKTATRDSDQTAWEVMVPAVVSKIEFDDLANENSTTGANLNLFLMTEALFSNAHDQFYGPMQIHQTKDVQFQTNVLDQVVNMIHGEDVHLASFEMFASFLHVLDILLIDEKYTTQLLNHFYEHLNDLEDDFLMMKNTDAGDLTQKMFPPDVTNTEHLERVLYSLMFFRSCPPRLTKILQETRIVGNMLSNTAEIITTVKTLEYYDTVQGLYVINKIIPFFKDSYAFENIRSFRFISFSTYSEFQYCSLLLENHIIGIIDINAHIHERSMITVGSPEIFRDIIRDVHGTRDTVFGFLQHFYDIAIRKQYVGPIYSVMKWIHNFHNHTTAHYDIILHVENPELLDDARIRNLKDTTQEYAEMIKFIREKARSFVQQAMDSFTDLSRHKNMLPVMEKLVISCDICGVLSPYGYMPNIRESKENPTLPTGECLEVSALHVQEDTDGSKKYHWKPWKKEGWRHFEAMRQESRNYVEFLDIHSTRHKYTSSAMIRDYIQMYTIRRTLNKEQHMLPMIPLLSRYIDSDYLFFYISSIAYQSEINRQTRRELEWLQEIVKIKEDLEVLLLFEKLRFIGATSFSIEEKTSEVLTTERMHEYIQDIFENLTKVQRRHHRFVIASYHSMIHTASHAVQRFVQATGRNDSKEHLAKRAKLYHGESSASSSAAASSSAFLSSESESASDDIFQRLHGTRCVVFTLRSPEGVNGDLQQYRPCSFANKRLTISSPHYTTNISNIRQVSVRDKNNLDIAELKNQGVAIMSNTYD